jgi:hypothetical protein
MWAPNIAGSEASSECSMGIMDGMGKHSSLPFGHTTSQCTRP